MQLAQNLLIVFLMMLIMLTAIDPAMAVSKKKKSKADIEVQKQLDPIVQELTPLSNKGAARGLFSPDEVAKAMELKLKLLDLINEYPTSPLLVRPAYEAGRLFKAREQYDDAFDFYHYIEANFPNSPYATMARVEIQRMKQQLGNSYFADDTAAPAKVPATTAKP